MSNKLEYSFFDPAEIPCKEISDPDLLVKEPVVSVNMITYNHAPYIAQAINGVLQQKTIYPYELIIGEDCSRDATREIVFEYQKKHPNIIRVITSDYNVGARRNNRRVCKACRGRYVANCEGDDYWHHPQKLQKQVGYLESHPDVGLVHSAVDILYPRRHGRRMKGRDGVYFQTVLENQKDLFLEMMLGKYQLATVSVCVRKDLLNFVMNSDPEVYLSDQFVIGDLPLWLDLSQRTRFHYFDESLSTYRILDESKSHSKDHEKVKRYKLSAFDLRLYYLKKYSLILDDSERRQVLKYLAMLFLRLGFALNDYEMVQMGKNISGEIGIEGLFLYHIVTKKYLRIAFLPIQYIANKRWAWGCGFLNAKS